MNQSDFYYWQLVVFVIWWVLIYLVTGKHLFSCAAAKGSALTRPKFISTRSLLFLHSDSIRRVIYCSVPIVLVGGVFVGDSSVAWRSIVAVVISVYHLTESSSTHRHGEFPVLYIAWTCCLFPSKYSQAAAHGVVVHFVLSTGIAKLWIGGKKWLYPETMRTYLSIYYNSSSSKPLLKYISRFVMKHDWLCCCVSVITLLTECVFVPATLAMPHPWRLCGCWLMILLHIGIAICMSLNVGIAFLTVIPSYMYGFSSNADLLSLENACAVVIGLGPLLFSWLCRNSLLPEHWPLCPIALFMFNGEQASIIASKLMTGDTRIVMGTAEMSKISDKSGMPVLHHGALVSAAGTQGFHDVVLRVIAFTLLQSSLHSAIPPNSDANDWSISNFLGRLELWLCNDQRMIESHTGNSLTRAYFVRIDTKRNVILDVVMDTHMNTSVEQCKKNL